MAVDQHKKEAPETVRCMVITVSDTRTKETDKSGKLMIEKLEEAQHVVVEHRIVKDERATIETAIQQGIRDEKIEVVLTNGGTGIALRDVTIETVTPLLEKEIPGFGELFRMLSYKEDIGSAAILSRATAGVSGGTAIFSTPGSSGAVKLAMNKLILPEITHVVGELHKDL
ncbi:molybdenum cofactor biosynthesis protein MoaB [Halobacillus shinanisalinarum]|uniref:Molybdenum cofactor biosynthesis protein B n=1 Tax=Halobacillus shinanisalinarum TaxID=2932258 RepID=A0ABY4H112_9BACI|nr:molybdenum cofactor biosynthesis protein B [Halobacillus shinanisalinarum]UOQ94135.1 molybdenum cofactor biosynthesis protein MoaB [Halobacillus shinanisalinarum]